MTSTGTAVAFGMAAGLFVVPVLIERTLSPSTPPLEESAGPTDSDVSLTGCIVHGSVPATFILHDAKKNPADPFESGADYVLVPRTVLYLESHLTHIVRISGEIGPEDLADRRLNAKSLAMAAGSCADESPDDKSAGAFTNSRVSGSGGRIGFADLASNGMSGFGMGSPTVSSRSGSSSRAVPRSVGVAYFGGSVRLTSLSDGSGSGKFNSVATSAQSDFGTGGTSGWMGSAMPGSIAGILAGLGPETVGPTIAINSAAMQTGIDAADAHRLEASSVSAAIPIVNPEPATLVLLGTGLLLAARAGRRRVMSTRRRLQ